MVKMDSPQLLTPPDLFIVEVDMYLRRFSTVLPEEKKKIYSKMHLVAFFFFPKETHGYWEKNMTQAFES